MTTLSTYFPNPEGLKFTEWGAVVAEQLATYGVAAPINEDGWKTWVCALFMVPDLVSLNIPTADGIDSWQQWAEQFIGSVR
jgi:hypothetical protein